MKYYKMKNFRCFEVKYLGPTNTMGSRIKISEEKFGGGKISITIPYDYNYNDIGEIAYNHLKKLGFTIKFRSCLKNVDLLFSNNWGLAWIDLK